MIPRRTAEAPLGSLHTADQPVTIDTVEVKRNKFLVAGGVSAVITAISLIFFPGDLLFADGKWIRIITLPFVASYIEVPYWSKQAFAMVYLALLLLTIAFLLVAWKYHKLERRQPRLDDRRNVLNAPTHQADHVIHLTGAKDDVPSHSKSTWLDNDIGSLDRSRPWL